MTIDFNALKDALAAGRVLLPGEAGFEDSLKRWSSAVVLPAVRTAKIGSKVPATAD